MRNTLQLLSIFIIIISFTSCKSWFDKNIQSDSVNIISPFNNFTDSILTVDFRWDKLDGATQYQIQIVKPSFDSIVNFVLDSIVSDVVFQYDFTPGFYQWRIRGVNREFESKWTTRNINILDSESLFGQKITNQLPLNNVATSNFKVNFSWNNLTKADEYLFYVEKNGVSITPIILTQNSYEYTFTSEGEYTWVVEARNSISSSLKSSYKVFIDTTKPKEIVFVAPLNDTILVAENSNFTFRWTNPNDIGSVITDSLVIASDSLFTQVKFQNRMVNLNQTVVDISTFTAGVYYWRINRRDKADNVLKSTKKAKFTLQ